MEEYYNNQMDKGDRAVYHAMKMGLLNLESSFSVPRMEGKELADIFFKLRLDHPEIFYGVGFHYRFYENALNVEFIPEYLFEQGKIKEHQKAMKGRVEKLIRPAQNLSEWEKEIYIHDFICKHVRYDKLKKPYSHEIIGALGHGVSVCEGIAKTVKILCDALQIWCIIAISDSNPTKKIKYRHAWNILRIDGKYYHLDATFDNTLSCNGFIRYDYFNLEDQQVFKDHEPVIYKVPKCDTKNQFYYMVKKLSFTKKEELTKRAVQAMKKKKPLIFHWRGGYLTCEVLSQIQHQLEEGDKQKEMHARIGLNQTQGVFQVFFSEEVPVEEYTIQEVNEGEKS